MSETREQYRRRRDAALRLPPLADGRRDPDLETRRRQSLGESVDELRAILGREVFPDLVELRARLVEVEILVGLRDDR